MCSSNHRCIPRTCASQADCPDLFACVPEKVCAREKCTSDDDCGPGACVNGACYNSLGTCTPPP
jgi:hypothetical protein